MNRFQTKVPLIYFEEGAAQKTGSILKDNGVKNVLVVYDKGIKAAGIVDPIIDCIKEAGVGCVEFSEVVPDPVSTDVNKGVKLARESGVDAVLGIGGGSSMDTAKAIWVMLGNPEEDDVLIFMAGGAKRGQYKVPDYLLMMIPTTSGTGSEVSDGAIITDEKAGVKKGFLTLKIVPDIALIDPLVEVNLPMKIAAPCAMDALSHCMESYILGGNGGLGPVFNAWSEMMALEGTRQIFTYLPKLMKDPHNVEYRAHIKFACLVAGLAMTSGGLACGHGMAHAMGMVWHLPHGVGCGLGLVPALRQGAKLEYNDRDRVARLAEAAGVKLDSAMDKAAVVDALVKAAEELIVTAEIPTLRELGKSKEEWLDKISERTMEEAVAKSCATLEDIRGYFEYLFDK